MSANGRYVAFWSVADNLSRLDKEKGYRRSVFVRDLETHRTVLASRQSAVLGGANADGHADELALSANGRYVAFRSPARNLSRADRDSEFGRLADVFVRDLKTKRTILVSRQSAAEGGAGANFASGGAAVSATGRSVAFHSYATNLSRAANKKYLNVFVRDLKTKRTILVSRQSAAGGAGANHHSNDPAVSADGRYVAFDSFASNLSRHDKGFNDVFLRDLQTERTVLVSRLSAVDGGAGATGDSYRPSVSGDGRYVAFKSSAKDLSGADADDVDDVFVRDMKTDTTVLVSRQSAAEGGAGANFDSYYPAVSADGRYIGFSRYASNLSEHDNDRVGDVFVRDLRTNTTTLVSRQAAGAGGAGGDRHS